MKHSGAIRQMEEELKGCMVRAQSEFNDPNTRELGKLRMEMVSQCQKVLRLIKHK
jgi:hypothetical protein